MVSLQEIQSRMLSTEKTSHITRAMNMVSVAKLHQAESSYKNFSPYITKLYEMVEKIIASSEKDIDHCFLKKRSQSRDCYVAITSNRGLAGAFNSNVLRKVYRDIQKSHKDESTYEVIAIGRVARDFFRSQGIIPLYEITDISDRITFHIIQKYFRDIINFYTNKKVDTIYVYHNHFVSTIDQEVKKYQLLPFCPTNSNVDDLNDKYEFEPQLEDIIDALLSQYLDGSLYMALLDSRVSEHAARMTAMKNATDNAEDLISELSLAYNRIRQASITQEITEIVGGAVVADQGY